MKGLIAVVLLISSCTNSTDSDIQKGWDSFDRRDYVNAYKVWRPLAEAGHSVAQYGLGQIFEIGEGVSRDKDEAVKWYKLSAEQGYFGAQNRLGYLYESGYLGIVNQDKKEAVKWYRLSAEQGNPLAQSTLGKMYEFGNGITKDSPRAHMWYNIAVSHDWAYAPYAASMRDDLAKKMLAEDILKAQDMARECEAKSYKGC